MPRQELLERPLVADDRLGGLAPVGRGVSLFEELLTGRDFLFIGIRGHRPRRRSYERSNQKIAKRRVDVETPPNQFVMGRSSDVGRRTWEGLRVVVRIGHGPGRTAATGRAAAGAGLPAAFTGMLIRARAPRTLTSFSSRGPPRVFMVLCIPLQR